MANSQGSPPGDPARALVAIMFSDVAEYTLIMGDDEQKGIQVVAEHRKILQSQVPKFGGRIITDAGDDTLSSFPSAVQAVNCAREIQKSLSDNSAFSVRIVIHVDDVVFADGNVLGDGVNIASRIHSMAPRGGICISARVYEEIRNQSEIGVQDLGEQRLKHVERPVHVYLLTVGRQGFASWSNRPLRPIRRHRIAIVSGSSSFCHSAMRSSLASKKGKKRVPSMPLNSEQAMSANEKKLWNQSALNAPDSFSPCRLRATIRA